MSNPKTTLINQIQQLAGVENVLNLLISPESNDFMVVEIYFSPESVVDRLTPEEIALRNYNATVKRGLIDSETKVIDFCKKIEEENQELFTSWFNVPFDGKPFDYSELADISLVCDAMAHHYGIDLQAEKEKKMRINETRTD